MSSKKVIPECVVLGGRVIFDTKVKEILVVFGGL